MDDQIATLLIRLKMMEHLKEIAITTAMITDYIWQDKTIHNRLDMAYELAEKFVDQYPVDTNWHELKGEGDWDQIIYEFVDKYLNLNNRNNG